MLIHPNPDMEKLMLPPLELQLLEVALDRLYNNDPENLPQELQKLSQTEWFLLERLLRCLMQEKAESQLH